MPRRADVVHREQAPDAVYGSVLVSQLINRVMLDGKKTVAQKAIACVLMFVGALLVS